MEWKKEWKKLALLAGLFVVCFHLPVGRDRFDSSVLESLRLVKWYAREHVLFCLVPAFFIAGAIAVFLSRASVMKHLGREAPKALAYGVASVSGAILAVCSCTVLPLFAGIYRMGAGLGPAVAFLYSGPAINVLAIALTARVLGVKLGVARAVGAILFSVVVGLLMAFFFRKEETARSAAEAPRPTPAAARPLWQNAAYFFTMVAILVFANWGKPVQDTGIWQAVYSARWAITSALAVVLAVILVVWFRLRWWKMLLASLPAAGLALRFPASPTIPFAAAVIGLSIVTSTDKGDAGDWFSSAWRFARQILPLLFAGVLVAGLLLGSPESSDGGLIPSRWIAGLVGGNSFRANLFAAVAGAFMYFATLTEVPILQGLMHSGMGDGPALALLLAGPALSLPNMLVIRSVLGTSKTVVFVVLIVAMATISGLLYGLMS